jgi:hypothetical protein
MVDKQEIAGAVTAVVTVDRTLHLESTGHADLASHANRRHQSTSKTVHRLSLLL